MVLRWSAALAAIAITAGSATADDGRREADEHARRGVAFYKLGRYETAIEEFEQAYVLYPSDTLLYNLGQSHRQLDHCREALDYYRRFLDAQPTSALAAKVSELIPALEHACAVKFEKPVDVAPSSSPSPLQPPPPPQGAPASPPSPAENEALMMRGGLCASVLVSGGATGTPVGPEVAVTHEIADGALELGAQLGAGWFPGAPGTTATAVTARALALRTVWRGDVDLVLGGGAGFLVLSSAQVSMLSPSHVDGGAFAIPEVAAIASARRVLDDTWEAALDLEAAVGASGELNGGLAASFGVSLSLGYRR